LLDFANEARHKKDWIQAVEWSRQAIALVPGHAPAYLTLGHSLRALGETAGGEACFQAAIQLDATLAEPYRELALAWYRRGDREQAFELLQRGTRLAPHDATLWETLGRLLRESERNAEAVAAFSTAARLAPDSFPIQYLLGRAWHVQKQPDRAEPCYRAALALRPAEPFAAYYLGIALKERAAFKDAAESFELALQSKPHFAAAWYELGNCRRTLRQFDIARHCYEKTLQLDPQHSGAAISLGNVLHTLDFQPEAADAYRRVFHRVPNDPIWDLWTASLCPLVMNSPEEILEYRKRLGDEIARVAERGLTIDARGLSERACPPPYNLQFHGLDDLPLKRAYADLFARHLRPPARPTGSGAARPRVGFVVTDGHQGVFCRYMGGLLERLDTSRLDPVVISSPIGITRIQREIRAGAFRTLRITSNCAEAAESIAGERLDLLYHWEVGSDVTNYFLPFLGLAPVQCTGVGLPETTGIPAMDAFLSSDCCEPPQSEAHYSEQLIRGRTLLTWQRRIQPPTAPLPREAFGIAAGEHAYVCAHKLGKLHPAFDQVLAEILRQDERGIVLIPQDESGHAARRLKIRLAQRVPDIADRIRLVPYQNWTGYLSLLMAADVLLDPQPYGGGLSSWDVFSLNRPIVTLAGEFLRGRFTAGFYTKMGLSEFVAGNVADYIALARRLACDRDFREHREHAVRERSEILFQDAAAVREFEEILLSLISNTSRH